MTHASRRRALVAALGAGLAGTALTGLLPAATALTTTTIAAGDVLTLGDPVGGPADIAPSLGLTPSQAQRDAAAALGAQSVSWNDLGTPASILPAGDWLARTGKADPEAAARDWLTGHADVLGLSPAQAAALELVNVQRLAQSDARAVLFQQRFGGLAPASGGLVTVGVVDGNVAYVSSSLSRATTLAAPAPADTPAAALAAWLTAAGNVGLAPAASVSAEIVPVSAGGWTRFHVPGFAQEQQVRLRALPTADGVRPVWEANVVNAAGGSATAFTILVDAANDRVLSRHNQVENYQGTWSYSGAVTNTACGPRHPLELTDDKTRTVNIAVAAGAADDITVSLYGPDGTRLAQQDLLSSPEVLTYSAATLPAGVYTFEVCPYSATSIVDGSYSAQAFSSDAAAPSASSSLSDPRWTMFTSAPTSATLADASVPTNTSTLCWTSDTGCDDTLAHLSAPGPWDVVSATGGVPSFTTVGNNAITHEAWVSPLTPGGGGQAPYSATRDYPGVAFTDAWNNSKCDPGQFVPGGNDIDFTVGDLFATHNRMHDWSYYLGFTEANYNLQTDNMGRGGTGHDAEVGNAQAGGASHPVISTPIPDSPVGLTGRDNANQITLQDGVPGITNQYLFAPIAGAFYSPCADGSLDMGIVGHEYTHAISNRMVAGPDQSLSGMQAGSMGESWSDLDAAEYMFAHGYGTNPWAVGAYATGNEAVAIRDFAIDKSPLNYSDIGFDHMGSEVHADGEVWNAVQWNVRKALVSKYDATYPSTDAALERRCADATPTASPLAPQYCPGDRRWIQLVFDSFLLQANGSPSMLDMRDAMIGADKLRFGGADVAALWKAFAQVGMGATASSNGSDDTDPTPGFSAPDQANTAVTFKAPADGRIYVGDFEARATPVADTVAGTPLPATATFVPGTYRMLYVSPANGFQHFTMTVTGKATQSVSVSPSPNLAAAANGASVVGASPDSRNPASLIDGTESTNWGGTSLTSVDETHPSIAVDLAGGVRTVRTVGVSALLRPADDSDPDATSRFTALRSFALEACTTACDTPLADWRRFYTSPDDAFPARRPRPVAPDLTMRFFDVPDTQAAAVRLVVLDNQCTGYAGYAGEQDNDPLTTTDCKAGSTRDTVAHAAELQVFDTATPRG